MDAMAIMKEATKANMTGRGMFALIAIRLGIDYCEDREVEHMIAKGKWIEANGDKRWDNEKWSKNNWPESYNNVEGAFTKVGRIQALWYHMPSLNLVLYDGKQKAGIRMSDLRVPLFGFRTDRLQAFINGLEANVKTSVAN